MVKARRGVIEEQMGTRNWTIYKLAGEVGVSDETIRKVLRGHGMSRTTEAGIRRAFPELSFDDLFIDTESAGVEAGAAA